MITSALALALVAAPSDRQEQRLELDQVEAVMTFAWPDDLRRGYFPIRVELANTGVDAAQIEVRARHMYGTHEIDKRVRLAGGERLAFDLLCRAEASIADPYVIEVEQGSTTGTTSQMGPSESMRGERRAILALSAESLAAGVAEIWGESMEGAPTLVAGALFDDMAQRHESYSSLDAVFLDSSAGLPESVQLDPLLAWVRLGGTLILHGDDAARVVGGSSDLAAWCEDRFLISATEPVGGRSYAFAQGRLVLLDRLGPWGEQAVIDFVCEQIDAAGATPGWTPGLPGARALHALPEGWPAPGLPLRALAAILVCFALLIGPANFVLVKKLGRPVLLLFTVPAVALLSAVLLLAYGIAAQGLDVKVTRASFAVLDQRQHRVSAADVQKVFAGLSPGAGLRPGPGTSVHLMKPGQQRWRRRFDQRYRTDLSEGVLLAGDFLPVRQVFEALTLTDDVARGRVDLIFEGDELLLENGLDARIEELVLRTPADEWFVLGARLPHGSRGALSACSREEGIALATPTVTAVFAGGPLQLPVGCYVASLASTPFVDDCGVVRHEVEGAHLLLGVLDEEPAR